MVMVVERQRRPIVYVSSSSVKVCGGAALIVNSTAISDGEQLRR